MNKVILVTRFFNSFDDYKQELDIGIAAEIEQIKNIIIDDILKTKESFLFTVSNISYSIRIFDIVQYSQSERHSVYKSGYFDLEKFERLRILGFT